MAFQATVVQRKLEKAGFDPAQALELASILEIDVVDHVEQTTVDRVYLDARLDQMQGKLDSRFAAIDAKFANVDARITSVESRLEGRMERGFAEVDGRFVALECRMEARFAKLDATLAEFRSDIIRWMIGMIGGGMLATLLTVLRFLK